MQSRVKIIARAAYAVCPDYFSTQFSGPEKQNFETGEAYKTPMYARAMKIGESADAALSLQPTT